MSAFLKYSQTRRSLVKEQNPDMSNTDVSRLLGEMWRGASQKERHPYVEQEERERAIYKQQTAEFRAKQAQLDAASRTSHVSLPPQDDHRRNQSEELAPPAPNISSVYRQDHYHHHHSSHDHASHAMHYGYSFSHGKCCG